MSDEKAEPPPRRGRPTVEAPMTSISIRVPPAAHDRWVRIASRADKTLSELIRDVLILRVR